MTIENENVRQQHSVVNGQASYGYNFKVLNEADLKVVVTSPTGTEVVSVLTAHYTVSGVGSQSGGLITFNTLYIPNTSTVSTVTIILDPALKQAVDLSYGLAIDSEALEGALDNSVNLVKRANDLSNRALHLTESSPVTGGLWDANSNKLSNLTAGTAAADAVNKTQLDALQTQITTNDTDIASLQTQVTSNDTDITSLQTQVTSNDTDITSLQTQVTSNDTDITALQTTTGHASSGNSALSTRLTTAEGSITTLLDERTAWYMDTNNTSLTFDSATETLIEFERTTQGGSAAADGEFTVPFAGLWWASVTITCDPTSVTSGDRWLLGIGTDSFPNSHRHMYEVDGNEDHNSITFSTMVTCTSGVKIGCYLARHSGSGDYSLSTNRSTNFFTGFCVKKS